MREASTAGLLEAGLRDERHNVQGRNLTQDTSQQGYGWKFASTVLVSPESPEDYQKRGKRVAVSSSSAGQGGFSGGGFPIGNDFGEMQGFEGEAGFGGIGPEAQTGGAPQGTTSGGDRKEPR